MKDDNFQVQVKTGDDSIEVIFNGQLTINYIQKIKDSVGQQVDFSKDMVVVVDNPDNLDITFLQLLQSLKKTAGLNKLQFSVNSKLPSELESLVSNSGFSDLLNSNPVNN
jgi:hypothetical protein